MMSRIAAAIGLIAVMGGLGGIANANTPPLPAAEEKTIEIRDLVQKEMASGGIPGLQLAIVQQGKLVFTGAYGRVNIETPAPVTERTVFPINSISKAFTGIAVMQLVEAGKLDLDAPITKYLKGSPQAWAGITIRQLLAHSSGLPEIIDDNARLIDGAAPDAAWAKVQELPLKFSPGTQYSYNQTGYVALGKIIEQLAGESFADFVRHRQFNVAKMGQTRFGNEADAHLNLAPLYTHLTMQIKDMKTVGVTRSETPHARSEVFPDYVYPAGGIRSTAKDLAEWIITLQKLKLINKDSLAQLWTPQALKDGTYRGFDKTINGYALGWPVVRRAAHPAIAPTGGARAAIFVYPNDDLTVIVLTNLLGASPQRFIEKIASIYLPDLNSGNK